MKTTYIVLEQEKARELQAFCHSEAMRAARLVQSISERKNEQLVCSMCVYRHCHVSGSEDRNYFDFTILWVWGKLCTQGLELGR